MRFLFSVVLALFLSATVHAGIRDVGSGGAGVLKNGELYLLDLFEVGLQEPHIDLDIVADADILDRAQAMPHLGPYEKSLFAKKMTEIRRGAPRFANVLLLALSKYQWYLVETPLALIKEDTPLDLSSLEMVQIANRLESRIRIYRPYWQQLSAANKVALVIHELVYSIQRPTAVSRQSDIRLVDAIRVRSIVAWMLSPEFYNSPRSTVEHMTSYPNLTSRLRGSFLLNLDEDVAILNGYLEMGVSTELDRKMLCAEIGRQLQSVQNVVVRREPRISWSELHFASYQTRGGGTQFTLRLSTRTLLDARTPAFWRNAALPQATVTFSSNNISSCQQMLRESHEWMVKSFEGL